MSNADPDPDPRAGESPPSDPLESDRGHSVADGERDRESYESFDDVTAGRCGLW